MSQGLLFPFSLSPRSTFIKFFSSQNLGEDVKSLKFPRETLFVAAAAKPQLPTYEEPSPAVAAELINFWVWRAEKFAQKLGRKSGVLGLIFWQAQDLIS